MNIVPWASPGALDTSHVTRCVKVEVIKFGVTTIILRYCMMGVPITWKPLKTIPVELRIKPATVVLILDGRRLWGRISRSAFNVAVMYEYCDTARKNIVRVEAVDCQVVGGDRSRVRGVDGDDGGVAGGGLEAVATFELPGGRPRVVRRVVGGGAHDLGLEMSI
jgi:hypothetical protein